MDKMDHITVELCMGSACYALGNNKTAEALRAFLTESGLLGSVHIRGALCEGLCKNGPVVKINGVLYRDMTAGALIALVRSMTGGK